MRKLYLIVLVSCLLGCGTNPLNVRPFDQASSTLEIDSNSIELRLFGRAPDKAIDKPLLIVTHTYDRWDRKHAAKKGSDKAIAQFKQLYKAGFVVFLSEPGYATSPQGEEVEVRAASWYTDLKNPNLNLMSFGGEHELRFVHSEVHLLGGNFGLCQTTTMFDAIRGYQGTDELQITMFLGGLFQGVGGDADTLLKLYGEGAGLAVLHELKTYEKTSWRRVGASAEVFLGNTLIGRLGSGNKKVKIILK